MQAAVRYRPGDLVRLLWDSSCRYLFADEETFKVSDDIFHSDLLLVIRVRDIEHLYVTTPRGKLGWLNSFHVNLVRRRDS